MTEASITAIARQYFVMGRYLYAEEWKADVELCAAAIREALRTARAQHRAGVTVTIRALIKKALLAVINKASR